MKMRRTLKANQKLDKKWKKDKNKNRMKKFLIKIMN
jgi:hypothetical protein